jgi:hypothetical protein
MKTPTERAAEAMAIEPDPTDRDAIARARHRVAGETSLTRDAVRNLASGYLGPDELSLLEAAVARLRRLIGRSLELTEMSAAALQAQVDADPDMAGTHLLPDGRLVPAEVARQLRAEACEALIALDDGARPAGTLYRQLLTNADISGFSPAGARTFARNRLGEYAAMVVEVHG